MKKTKTGLHIKTRKKKCTELEKKEKPSISTYIKFLDETTLSAILRVKAPKTYTYLRFAIYRYLDIYYDIFT